MIDLEKERELFKSAMISSEIHQEEEFEIDEYGNFSWIGTDESFDVWRERAKLAKAEQEKLEAEFNANLAKVEQGIDAMAQGFLIEIESLKAQLAQQSDDYVSIKKSVIKQLISELDHIFFAHKLLGLTDLIALRDDLSLLVDDEAQE